MKAKENNRTWNRLKRNKVALVALVFIFTMIATALFAYILAPDNTKDANTICLEIATQKPGFSCLFFKKYKQNFKSEHSFLNTLINGKEADAELIPIRSGEVIGDSMKVSHFVDDEIVELLTFPIDPTIKNPTEQYILKRTFWLGTDKFGRDMLSRLLIGTRISLAVGFIAVIISILIGVLLGSFSAYY